MCTMDGKITNKLTMDNFAQILAFLNKIEKLKTVQRQISVSDNSRKESAAEHTWRMAVMAMLLHRELKLQVDLLKTLEIVLVHDIIEAVAGDVWIIDANDTKAQIEKEEREIRAAEEIFALLPKLMGEELKNLWHEYESKNSPEAKFAQALNKLEVMVQRTDLGIENWEERDFNIYQVLLHWADKSTDQFPELKTFWNVIQEKLNDQYANR